VTLTQDPQLTRQIIGLAMRVHSRLGPGLLERVYERCLCYELDRAELPYARQVERPLRYEEIILEGVYRADLIVRGEVLLELKNIDRILPVHEAQLSTDLRLRSCKVGLLLNFNTASLKDGIRRKVV